MKKFIEFCSGFLFAFLCLISAVLFFVNFALGRSDVIEEFIYAVGMPVGIFLMPWQMLFGFSVEDRLMTSFETGTAAMLGVITFGIMAVILWLIYFAYKKEKISKAIYVGFFSGTIFYIIGYLGGWCLTLMMSKGF